MKDDQREALMAAVVAAAAKVIAAADWWEQADENRLDYLICGALNELEDALEDLDDAELVEVVSS